MFERRFISQAFPKRQNVILSRNSESHVTMYENFYVFSRSNRYAPDTLAID